MTKYQDLGTSLCSSIFILWSILLSGAWKLCLSVSLSHSNPHPLNKSHAIRRANSEFYSLFFNTFINKSKHGQNTLPLLGRLKIFKRILMVLNVGIHNILNFLVFVLITFFMKKEWIYSVDRHGSGILIRNVRFKLKLHGIQLNFMMQSTISIAFNSKRVVLNCFRLVLCTF